MKTIPVIVASCLLLGVPVVSAPQASDPLDDLFARGRAAQASVKTVTASFTETTVSSLLRDPIVATGTVAATMPLRVVMTYTTPTPKTVAIDSTRLVVDWPSRKVREDIDIAETQRRVQKYFTSASPKELRETFNMTLSTEGETYRLDMAPKRKQVAEGLEKLRIWIDHARLVMVRMTMDYPGGDSKTLELSAIRTNGVIDESVFAILTKTPGR